jgi:hypothetical protein
MFRDSHNHHLPCSRRGSYRSSYPRLAGELMPRIYSKNEVTEFIDWLETTLIPDCYETYGPESGFAEDFEKCIAIINQLRAANDQSFNPNDIRSSEADNQPKKRKVIMQDSIVINEQFEPGNGTRYDIQLVRDGAGGITITWLLHAGVGGSSFRFNDHVALEGMERHVGYFMDKMGLTHEADAIQLIKRAQEFDAKIGEKFTFEEWLINSEFSHFSDMGAEVGCDEMMVAVLLKKYMEYTHNA